MQITVVSLRQTQEPVSCCALEYAAHRGTAARLYMDAADVNKNTGAADRGRPQLVSPFRKDSLGALASSALQRGGT